MDTASQYLRERMTTSRRRTPAHGRPSGGRDIVIHEGAWLASNVTILGPCQIGEHAVVAAGAVVVDDVRPYTVVGGVPARTLASVSAFGMSERSDGIRAPSIQEWTGHLRRAVRLKPSVRFLWRELGVRQEVMERISWGTGQPLHLRHQTQDLTGFTEVFVRRNYDFPPAIEATLQEVPAPVGAVDLGANIGLFGVRLLAQRPDAEMIAVEPDPANAEVLRATIARSDAVARWSVIQACAGITDGTVLSERAGSLSCE